jgi:hypothetical protein
MLKTIASIRLGAVISLVPLAALAQADRPAAPGASSTHTPTGSYRSQMRHRSNMSKERARASAEHVRHLRHGSQ